MRGRAIGLVFLVSLIPSVLVSQSLGIEKLKFASAVKVTPAFYLPMLAGQEKGFWKEKGLKVEWVPFKGGGAMNRAVAAGAINVGFGGAATAIRGASRGVPAVIVADLFRQEFIFWVRKDSRFRRPKDLKGSKIGVPRFGGTSDAMARVVAKKLGLEREVTFVSTGGVIAALAGLKTGKVDAVVQSPGIMGRLKMEGVVREYLSVADYLPKEWTDNVVFASRRFIREKPGTVNAIVQAVLRSIGYLRQDAAWTKAKMKVMSGYSDEMAEFIYTWSMKQFTRDGRVSRRALENVKKFLIDSGIIPKEKAPAIEDVFTSQFIG